MNILSQNCPYSWFSASLASPPGQKSYFSHLEALYSLYVQYKCWVQTLVAAKGHLDFLPSFTIFQAAAMFFL